jgi:hypothetical protein
MIENDRKKDGVEADSRIATKPGMPPWPPPPPVAYRDKEIVLKLLALAVDILRNPTLPKPLFRGDEERTPDEESKI